MFVLRNANPPISDVFGSLYSIKQLWIVLFLDIVRAKYPLWVWLGRMRKIPSESTFLGNDWVTWLMTCMEFSLLLSTESHVCGSHFIGIRKSSSANGVCSASINNETSSIIRSSWAGEKWRESWDWQASRFLENSFGKNRLEPIPM